MSSFFLAATWRRIAWTVRKNAALSFRISQRLKEQLEEVALKEGRSLSQVCEVMLRGGVEAYKRDGIRYFQSAMSARRAKPPTSE